MDGGRGNPRASEWHQLPDTQHQPLAEPGISAPPNTFLFSLLLPPVGILQESRILSGPIFGGQAIVATLTLLHQCVMSWDLDSHALGGYIRD